MPTGLAGLITDTITARASPDAMRIAANCIPCGGDKNWSMRCTCVEPCRSVRCSAAAEHADPFYAHLGTPLPRWLACSCCHAPSRSALIPYVMHFLCADCFALVGSPSCPKAWRDPSMYTSTPTPLEISE